MPYCLLTICIFIHFCCPFKCKCILHFVLYVVWSILYVNWLDRFFFHLFLFMKSWTEPYIQYFISKWIVNSTWRVHLYCRLVLFLWGINLKPKCTRFSLIDLLFQTIYTYIYVYEIMYIYVCECAPSQWLSNSQMRQNYDVLKKFGYKVTGTGTRALAVPQWIVSLC